MNKCSGGLVLSIFVAILASACASPEQQARATIAVMQAAPVATSAALDNQAKAVHVATVVPAQAAAEAKSVIARTDLQINEDRQKQELRHAGEMAAMTISNTMRLNTMDVQHRADIASIQDNSAVTQSKAQQNIDTNRASGFGAVILVGGISIAVALAALALPIYTRNRAQVVKVGSTSIVLKGDQMFQPENSLDRYTAVDRVPRWARFLIWLKIVWRFNPAQKAEDGTAASNWDVVDRARQALAAHGSISHVDHPQEVAQLRQMQLQLEGIKSLAKKMNGSEAREAAAALSTPRPAPLSVAPEIGWLPAPEKADAYQLLESETGGQ